MTAAIRLLQYYYYTAEQRFLFSTGFQENFSCDASSHLPRGYSIGFTNHNLLFSSPVRYISTAEGMSPVNIESLGCLKKYIKTCKSLEHATRQRIVWVTVLHQVCLDNALFLPSFPIIDMSNLELERAAMGPRRWIGLCVRGALENKEPTCGGMLHTRQIRASVNLDHFFIVPGGRYIVTADRDLSVWDLGYVPTADFNLVASVDMEDYCEVMMVQATPDGKGLVILICYL